MLRTGTSLEGDALDKAWREFRRRMARRGFRERRDEGPLDYFNRLKPTLAESDARRSLEALIQRYVELRYAQTDPNAVDIQAFARKLREFKLPRAVKVDRSSNDQ